MGLKFLHTMIRVSNLEASMKFYQDVLGLEVVRRTDYEEGRFTLVFLRDNATGVDIELTHNWDTTSYNIGNGFGHLAFGCGNIEEICNKAEQLGYNVPRKPGAMKHGTTVIAFIEDPDKYKIELIQK